MKYVKGTSEQSLESMPMAKIRLFDNEDFSETPWAKRMENNEGFVLQNHALAFTPWPSWGAIMPSSSFNFIEMVEKQELTLHPEAYDYYLKEKWIDEDGNGLENLR